MTENTTPTIVSGSWVKDAGAYDPNSRIRAFTFMGRGFIARSSMAGQADAWPFVVRDATTDKYVATVGNWGRLAEELAAKPGGRVSMSQMLHVDYDGDPEALSWPIMLGTRVVGSLLQVERGYRARREAGGVAHLGPERPFTDQVLEDLWRWIEAPLSNQHAWTEATD